MEYELQYDKYINISHGSRMAFAVFLRLLQVILVSVAVKYTTNSGTSNEREVGRSSRPREDGSVRITISNHYKDHFANSYFLAIRLCNLCVTSVRA